MMTINLTAPAWYVDSMPGRKPLHLVDPESRLSPFLSDYYWILTRNNQDYAAARFYRVAGVSRGLEPGTQILLRPKSRFFSPGSDPEDLRVTVRSHNGAGVFTVWIEDEVGGFEAEVTLGEFHRIAQ